MATNFYFNAGIPGGRTSEQRLVENLIIEAIKIYGFDLFYLPRTAVKSDSLFLDDTLATFESAIPIECYLENVNGYGGDGELMSKFGIELRDTCTFIMVRSRWEDTVLAGRSNTLVLPERPAEGDLLYMPITKSFFEIKFVEARDPFFQLGKLYVYKLKCELWQYSSEKLNTGQPAVDTLETTTSMDTNQFKLSLENGGGLLLNTIDYQDTNSGYLLQEGFFVENQDPLANNEAIREEALTFVDFSESNPFGEVLNEHV